MRYSKLMKPVTRIALEAATPTAEEWVEKVVADEFARANSLWWLTGEEAPAEAIAERILRRLEVLSPGFPALAGIDPQRSTPLTVPLAENMRLARPWASLVSCRQSMSWLEQIVNVRSPRLMA